MVLFGTARHRWKTEGHSFNGSVVSLTQDPCSLLSLKPLECVNECDRVYASNQGVVCRVASCVFKVVVNVLSLQKKK